MYKRHVILAGIILTTFFSCNSYKNIPYFQDLDHSKALQEDIDNYSPVTIQAEDILGITVTSLNPEASAVFNYASVNSTNPQTSEANNLGYLVDQKGEIQLPLIGSIKVAGLTTSRLREEMRKKLLVYLKEPVVSVRIVNFKVSVMGDVARPGVFQVQNERLTLTEALSLAGDLNITGKRKVLLVRESDGKRHYIPIDLRSKDLFTSQYYYMKSNDVIYVQPDKTKFASVDNSYRSVGLALSGLSIIAVILTRVL